MPLNVFFDTEFTDISSNEPPFLISIGFVTEDGREFYAELTDTYDFGQCSDFVRANVLPLLQGGAYRMSEAQLAARLKEWIESLGAQEAVLRCDSPSSDWPLAAGLFQRHNCWPANLRRQCGAIDFDLNNQWRRYEDCISAYWRDHAGQEHHALEDARSMLFAWKYATGDDSPLLPSCS